MAEVQQAAQAVGQIDLEANAAPAEEALSQNGQGKGEKKGLWLRGPPADLRELLKLKRRY